MARGMRVLHCIQRSALLGIVLSWLSLSSSASDTPLSRIITHQNRTPAGTLNEHVLHLRLEITEGEWYPEAEDGPHIAVYAFDEP